MELMRFLLRVLAGAVAEVAVMLLEEREEQQPLLAVMAETDELVAGLGLREVPTAVEVAALTPIIILIEMAAMVLRVLGLSIRRRHRRCVA
jgi:hypothetical protein